MPKHVGVFKCIKCVILQSAFVGKYTENIVWIFSKWCICKVKVISWFRCWKSLQVAPGAQIATFPSVCFTLSLKKATERQLCLKWLPLLCSFHFHIAAILNSLPQGAVPWPRTLDVLQLGVTTTGFFFFKEDKKNPPSVTYSTLPVCSSNNVGFNTFRNYANISHLCCKKLNKFSCYSTVQSPSWAANWFAASQEIPRISRNPKVHYRTHKRPPLVSILGQPNPVHIPTSNLLEIHPNITHPSTPRSPQLSLSLRFPHQDPIQPPLLTHTRHNIGWGVQII